MKLLLFDIDGTLIRSNGAGRETLRYALEQVFETAGPLEEYKFSGKTDSRIILDLMTAAGFSSKEVQAKLPAVYEMMAQRAAEIFPHSEMSVCTGIPELLATLQQNEDVILGLLTGNSQLTAPLKLTHAGIEPSQFVVGVYGSDALDRNELPFLGMERAQRLTGIAFSGKNTVIIGDTPADIRCARAGRATAVAVATGWHSDTTLEKYKPDHLFHNLSETEQVINVLLNHEGPGR